ncbi:MFS transporter [Azospirillum sp. SYSU D00513]|uniref:MFS transporter n=1 Tax=Azospirillum sp. SYSU D00513 TaxID=2812561 RepID=UPI001A960913|nr:MFS transporter [Azospirillum sp. SYSU D00513]
MQRAPETRWGQVTVAVLAGIAAALHIGKVPPALPMLRAELGMDLVAAGWLMALVSGLGAVSGLLFGRLADQLTHRTAMLLGLATLAAGSLAGALSGSAGPLLASRLLESMGLILTIVAAPGHIASVTRPRDMRLSLALWGVWLPAGVAAMMLASPPLLAEFGWRGTWAVAALACLASAAALLASPRVAPREGGVAAPSLLTAVRLTAAQPASWMLAGVFVAYSMSFMSVFGFLPTMLVEQLGMDAATASVLCAVAVLANALGNVMSGVLARMGVPRWVLIAGPCVMLSLTALVVFTGGLPFGLRYGAALLYAVIGGLLPATIMGALPAFAPRPNLVGTISGFVMQGSNIGQFIGPPLLASVVATHGWSAAPFYIACATAIGLVLALGIRPLERGLRVK